MDREDGEHGNAGRVSYRIRGDTSSLPDAFDSPRGSRPTRNAYAYSFAPPRSEGTSHFPDPRRPGSPLSEPDLMPPDIGPGAVPPGNATSEDSWFKSWLTMGILDVLGTAAGVTLSTTGKLVAPPLHLTKNILLPGLLALIVDTLDSITPPRVKDWFRILSASSYHLITVLGSTEKGKIFSSQFYIVLQDVMQALSAPESRQVLVDGMATSVKFAAALHTPEMVELLEQLSTLGIRLLDAASSGKAKQLIQDSRDMAWKGIEMAADPATTLALAEVTAHLCHALEDTQQALNPTPRKHRNAQNQTVYLNPYQMADFPEQVMMEEVILSCLGLVEHNKKEHMGDDQASLHSRLTLDDDLSLPEPESQGWKERKARVNVQLLRERILNDGLAKSRTENLPTSSVASLVDEPAARDKGADGVWKGDGFDGTTGGSITAQPSTTTQTKEEDVEDIACSGVPGGRRFGVKQVEKASLSAETPPAIQQFYERLDELLEEDRQRLQSLRAREESTINNSLEKEEVGEEESKLSSILKARITKLKQRHASKHFNRDTVIKPSNFSRIPKKYHGLIIAVAAIGTLLFTILFGLAMYGVYALVKGAPAFSADSRNYIAPSPSNSQDIVIRIVREIVHVTEKGEIIGESRSHALTQEELESIGQNVVAVLR